MNDLSFSGVTAQALANIYFDGKVVSHTLLFPDGSKKTLGILFPGSFEFGTSQPELMQITAGSVQVRLRGEAEFTSYQAGQSFSVPANSSFEITIEDAAAQYVCSYG